MSASSADRMPGEDGAARVLAAAVRLHGFLVLAGVLGIGASLVAAALGYSLIGEGARALFAALGGALAAVSDAVIAWFIAAPYRQRERDPSVDARGLAEAWSSRGLVANLLAFSAIAIAAIMTVVSGRALVLAPVAIVGLLVLRALGPDAERIDESLRAARRGRR